VSLSPSGRPDFKALENKNTPGSSARVTSRFAYTHTEQAVRASMSASAFSQSQQKEARFFPNGLLSPPDLNKELKFSDL
jgi:hypothetical protein